MLSVILADSHAPAGGYKVGMDPSSNGFNNEDHFEFNQNNNDWNEYGNAPITKTIKVPYPVKVIVDRPYPVYKQIVVSKPVPYPVNVAVPVWHVKKVAVPKPYPVLKYVAVNNYIPVYFHTYHQTWRWSH